MRSLFKTAIYGLVLLTGGLSFSAVNIAKHNGSGFAAVDTAKAQAECGANFAFRDQYQSEIPKYLEPEVIKLSFKGVKLHATLDEAKAEASKGGKCLWYSDSEKGQLGL